MNSIYELNTRNNTRNKEDRMETFWICYIEGTDGGRHYRHWSLEDAQTEAERLAECTGKKVYLLKCIGVCQIEPLPVKWEVPR